MKRRQFITLVGGAVAWPVVARAQQPVRVVGVLASQPLPPVQRFVRKLREYGYVEGENLRLQSHAGASMGRSGIGPQELSTARALGHPPCHMSQQVLVAHALFRN